MDSFLQRLRNKSDASKRRIVLFSSLAVTLLIAFFWVVSLRVTGEFGNGANNAADTVTDSAQSSAAAGDSSPFSTLGASASAIGSAFSQMKSDVEGLFSAAGK